MALLSVFKTLPLLLPSGMNHLLLPLTPGIAVEQTTFRISQLMLPSFLAVAASICCADALPWSPARDAEFEIRSRWYICRPLRVDHNHALDTVCHASIVRSQACSEPQSYTSSELGQSLVSTSLTGEDSEGMECDLLMF